MRRYLIILTLGWMLPLAVIVGVNWAVDPYAISETINTDRVYTNKPAIALNERIFKTVGLAHEKFDVVFLGTSRTDIGLNPDHPAFIGRKVVNLGVSSQPYIESKLLLTKSLNYSTQNPVIFGVDFFPANANLKQPKDFTEENYTAFRKMQLLMTMSNYLDSLKTLTGFGVGVGNRWKGNGMRLYDDMPASMDGNRKFFIKNIESYLNSTYLPEPQCSFSFKSDDIEPLQHVRSLIAMAHKANLDLRLFISPSHAWQWETLAAAGLWQKWEEWKRKLVLINEEEANKIDRSPFPLIDFSGYNSITTEDVPTISTINLFMDNYYDASHYSPKIGDILLDKIFNLHHVSRDIPDDFGVRITSENIETHLADIREERSTYRKSHTYDIQELEKVASETLRKKHCSPKGMTK